MEPIFSLIYTSVRAPRIEIVIAEWLGKTRAAVPLEVIVAVDANDSGSREAAESIAARDTRVKVYVQESEPFNCVKGWNLAAEKAQGKVLVQVTDDFSPPEGWDEKLLALKPANWIETDCAVHVDDGYVRNIMTLAIITRVRYRKFGYFFYPGYESIFCDTELTEVAYRDGVVIPAPHLLFEHMHPDCFKRQRDRVDLVHASQERWDSGEALFKFRKQHGFPVDAGPNAVVEDRRPVGTSQRFAGRNYCAYLQVTRDDFCLYEVCVRLHEEGVDDFFFSVPDEYWDGRPTPRDDIRQLGEIATRLRQEGISVHTKIFEVADYRFSGDTRIDTETRLRNDALAWVRGAGFVNILIVDGDELWLRGTLEMVDSLVARGHPVISSRMIPVCGLPGYPIDKAQDLAVVYIGGNCQFKACRTPFIEQKIIQHPQIIHFTGTRRTMEEIVAKHRTSGHYDDPDYDFEGWLKNILPNIKPGLRDVHMYKKFQIWPVVRSWFPTEKEQIPPSLHPYLGF